MNRKLLYEEVAQISQNNLINGYHHAKRMENIHSFLKEVVRKEKKQLKILDIGCGDGLLDEIIIGSVSPIELVGMDISRLRVKRARRRVLNASFIVADIYHLPFQRVFNVAIMSEIIEHLNAPYKALNEVQNILKNNGYLIFDAPSKTNIIDIFLRLLGREPTWGLKIDKTHVAFYDESTLKSLLHSAQFTVLDVQGVSFLRYDLLSLLGITWNRRRWWLPRFIDATADKSLGRRNMGAIQVFMCKSSDNSVAE